eukprot:CAMPEP_0196591964 /NCGR_PEP_ID=MMETSP1081-20130531/71405_1 /TAXON_ID=36882 /ORGANISM="Pyramimonas amylifera, Strain CCMP720" /LENGTH=1203 /DNA_ID=CAMNT_0041915509 /DNA_START=156 /DNA_END=3767 /DNA_ORIENTATION=-
MKNESNSQSDLPASHTFACWEFNVLLMENSMLVPFMENILLSMGAEEHLKVSKEVVHNFAVKVAEGYNEVQYHNLRHGVSTAHAMYYFLTQSEASSWYSPVESLALVVSALCHDLGHPGYSNTFLAASGHHLALEFNDTHVLENFHAKSAFKILRNKDANIFKYLEREQWSKVRELIIETILATDMSVHLAVRKAYKQRQADADAFNPNDNLQDRLLAAKLLMKAADLSTVVKPFESCKLWSSLLVLEFLNQGDKELALGIPRTETMDRESVNFYQSSFGFLDGVAQPFYQEFCELLPSLNELLLGHLAQNKAEWAEKEQLQEHESERQKNKRASAAAYEELKAHNQAHEGDVEDENNFYPKTTKSPVLFPNGELVLGSGGDGSVVEHEAGELPGMIIGNTPTISRKEQAREFQQLTTDLRISMAKSKSAKCPLEEEKKKKQGPYNPFEKLQAMESCQKIDYLVNGHAWQVVMAIATVFSIFLPDLKFLMLDKDSDLGISVAMIIIFVLYIMDFFIRIVVSPMYFRKLTMPIDFVSASTLVLELVIRRNHIGNSVENIVLRFIRLIRISHFLRLLINSKRLTAAVKKGHFDMKVTFDIDVSKTSRKMFLLASELAQSNNDDLEDPSNTWLSVSERMMQKLIVGMIVILICVLNLTVYETDRSTLAWLSNFDNTKVYTSSFNQTLVKFHLFNTDYDYDMIHLGMRELCEVTWLGPEAESLEDYLVRRENECLVQLVDKSYLMIEGRYGSRYTVEEAEAEYRPEVLLYQYSTSRRSFAIFNVHGKVVEQAELDMLLSLVVVLLLVVWFFSISSDARHTLITPIEDLVAMIKELKDDPLGFCERKSAPEYEEEDESMELKMVESAFVKISNITQVALGEAGMDILSMNLNKGSTINPMVPGRKIVACFGFCDIRNFTDATECLQEQVLPFVNAVGEVVHQIVVDHEGAPNKNIGDAFLVVWKDQEFKRKASSAYTSIQVDVDTTGKQPLSPYPVEVQEMSCADNGLQSFLACMDEIPKSALIQYFESNQALKARLGDFKVKLGYGLHVGWGIEGAIGSVHKIDPSYLSPHVNMSSRLESATKFYGVPILLSETVVENLKLPYHLEGVRKLDRVTVKGSAVPIKLYTFDRNVEAAGCLVTQQEYKQMFEEAVDLYLAGNWPKSMDKLRKCHEKWPSDKPAEFLFDFMQRTGGCPPSSWKGHREFDEK